MKLKKSKDQDLNLRRGFFFATGLLLVLLIIYILLEWKTPEDNDGYDISSLSYKELIYKNKKQDIEKIHILL